MKNEDAIERKEVHVEPIYYYRLFTVINGNIEVGSDYFIGTNCYSDTLNIILSKIKETKVKWNHFEIYYLQPSITYIHHNKIEFG